MKLIREIIALRNKSKSNYTKEKIMNPLFNEITETEASSTVGGRFLVPGVFAGNLFVGSDATASSKVSTVFEETGYPFATADTFTILEDLKAEAGSRSSASIVYAPDPIM